MQTALILCTTVLLALGSAIGAGAQMQRGQSRYIIQPSEGEQLRFCDTPELTVTIKVDSVTTGATRFAMGTAELTTHNFGIHRGAEEIIYFTKGQGLAVVGADTVMFQPGTTMYVPPDVRHGFINTGGEPAEFVWLMAPRGFEDRLREGAAAPGACPAQANISTEQEIVRLQKSWVQAALEGDADAFARFMDDGFKVTSRGRVRDKAAWVESIRSRQASYDDVRYHNVSVHVYGDTAVISGEYSQVATRDGRDNSGSGVFVGTWLKRDGRWRIIGSIYP